MFNISLETSIKIARIKKSARRAEALEEQLDRVTDREIREDLIREIYQVWQSNQHYHEKLNLEEFLQHIVFDWYEPKH